VAEIGKAGACARAAAIGARAALYTRRMASPFVVPLKREQLSEAAASLARAFQDDPLQTHVFPDPVERAARSPAHFGPVLEYGLRFGTVLTTAGEPTGSAVWLPPGNTHVTDDRAAEAGLDRLPELLGVDAATRFFAALSAVEPYHRSDMPEDHWYVLVVGVEPAAQGQGVGGAVLAPILEQAELDGLPCYLETAQPRNIGFYEHLGFRVLREIVSEENGLRFWTFRRDGAPR
jgi:ribosomal protein S18 acetylase RimI-like enzyme